MLDRRPPRARERTQVPGAALVDEPPGGLLELVAAAASHRLEEVRAIDAGELRLRVVPDLLVAGVPRAARLLEPPRERRRQRAHLGERGDVALEEELVLEI